jgi:hypothetical protein
MNVRTPSLTMSADGTNRITDFGARTLRAEAERLALAVSAARAKRLLGRKVGLVG